MKNKIKPFIIPPLAAFLGITVIYAIWGIFPFGDGLLSWGDMNQQVLPLLLDTKDIISGKTNMLFNLQNAGGINFWGIFLFFVSSPFSFLTALVPKMYMQQAVNIFIAIRIITIAFTSGIFFNKKYNGLSIALKTLFSVMYAFSGYVFFYYQNVVWLDVMALFPLLLLGFDALLKGKTPWGYVAALCYAMLAHFYLCYMLVMFLIIALILWLFICCQKDKRAQVCTRFIVYSFISALITAVVWLPALLQYSDSARGISLINSLKYSSFFTPIDNTLPMICMTAFILVCLPFALKRTIIQKNENFILFLLFSIMCVPLIIEPINKMWHTGSYQCFPARYGFIPCFLGICICASVLQNTKQTQNKLTGKEKTTAFIACGILTFDFAALTLAIIINPNSYENIIYYTRSLWANPTQFKYMLLFTLACVIVYLAWYLMYKYGIAGKRLLTVMMAFILSIEVIFNSCAFMSATLSNPDTYFAAMHMTDKIQDTGFYRVKTQRKLFDVNLLGGMGYSNLGHYTSLTSAEYMCMAKKLGYSSYWMEVGAYGGTLFTDALLSNNYLISAQKHLQSNLSPIYLTDKFSIYKNDIIFPNAVFVKELPKTITNLTQTNRFNTQNDIYKAICNTNKNLICKYYPKTVSNAKILTSSNGETQVICNQYDNPYISYTIDVKGEQVLYFDCFSNPQSTSLGEQTYNSFEIYVNQECIQQSYPSQRNNGILELGRFKNETVEIRLNINKSVMAQSIGVYGLDVAALNNAQNSLQGTDIDVNGNRVTAQFNAKNDGYLIFPLPISNDATVTVNGQKVTQQCVIQDLMAIPVFNGSNNIKITFIPQGIILGAVISAIGVILAIIIAIISKRNKIAFIKKAFNNFCLVLVYACGILVVSWAYIMPIAIFLLKNFISG